MPQLSRLDQFLHEAQHFLDTLSHNTHATRANPALVEPENELNNSEQRISQGCMRVNHTGEICAQALYRGQAFGTDNQPLKQHFNEAAREEVDHLHWCKERLDELHTHTSYLNSFWYCASFLIGFTAARLGDPLSLGFVEETEQQVIVHLDQHQKILPAQDQKSRAIIGVMKLDEAEHADNARAAGAEPLPQFLKLMMKLQSKVMTSTAYHI